LKKLKNLCFHLPTYELEKPIKGHLWYSFTLNLILCYFEPRHSILEEGVDEMHIFDN
jgi:hypothetical protein